MYFINDALDKQNWIEMELIVYLINNFVAQ